MQFTPIKTRPMHPPKDDLYDVLDHHLPRLREKDILVITSKVLAIHQGRCVKIRKDTAAEREKLIRQEADWYIPRSKRKNLHWHLTIKDFTLIANSGIDRSNGYGYYLLWPQNTVKLLDELRNFLRRRFNLRKLGVIAVDSHLVPLRAGTIGISTGFCGLEPLKDYRGSPDIFGRKLKSTRQNQIDPLAAISCLLMGEAKESTPLLLIRGAKLKFTNQNKSRELIYPPHRDIYKPLLKVYKKT